MKIIYVNTGIHHKNQHAIDNYKNIKFTTIHSVEEINNYNLNDFDCVYSPSHPIDVSLYPNTKFIFGPNFSVFPDNRLLPIKDKRENVVFNLLSEWVINIWKTFDICKDMRLECIPFGVDTIKFYEIKPIQEREKVLIYMKHRDPVDLMEIQKLLSKRNIDYRIFDYQRRYDEQDYINYLQECKYAIFIIAHESQGFAVQEALACNVPLFVWTVKSMNQELDQNYPDFYATSIPYWDNRCGEFFYYSEQIDSMFDSFLKKLNTYEPRKYILENLSMEVCEKRWIEIIKNK
jgi:hypothetical protein